MRKSVKIALGLVLICGFIAITSNQILSPVTSYPPYETAPDDPGNTPGPGYTSIPDEDIEFRFIIPGYTSIHEEDIKFRFLIEDTGFSNLNFQI